jgi:hypothetical protein
MDLLFSDNPLIQTVTHTKSISSMYNKLVNSATQFNIATGFISNDSIAELKQLIEYRDGELNLSLFIGMNYIEGFTSIQYKAVQDLDCYLTANHVGKVLLSPKALYHGKMYSFMQNDDCLAAFVGSSNLGSFVGTSQNLIEADAYFSNSEGKKIDEYISQISTALGKEFSLLPQPKLIPVDTRLLDGYTNVVKLEKTDIDKELALRTGEYVDIPLKTELKSNLNTYFGKGKVKGKYSPRGWYEVEIIVGTRLQNRELLPDKDSGAFTVITKDGYQFDCSRQGDYSKNLRSDKDLKILGRWIKGQMENCGVLEIGKPVTEETLTAFGRHFIRFEKTKSGKFILSLV